MLLFFIALGCLMLVVAGMWAMRSGPRGRRNDPDAGPQYRSTARRARRLTSLRGGRPGITRRRKS